MGDAVSDLVDRKPGTGVVAAPSWLLLAAVALVGLFLVAPWPLAAKAQVLLHGLCGQRPSHSLRLGADLLPFDARMTGIYGAFAVTASYLLGRGRLRALALPAKPVLALLGLFVAALAVDGGNAFLVDLGIAPLYAPDNRLRLLTGLLTGITLGAVVCHLLATTLWRRGDAARPTIVGVGEVVLLVALQAPIAAVAVSGVGLLYAPLTLLLVIAAVAAVWALTLTGLLLLRLTDRSYDTLAQAQPTALAALALALAIVAAMAGGRFWVERTFGIVPLT